MKTARKGATKQPSAPEGEGIDVVFAAIDQRIMSNIAYSLQELVRVTLEEVLRTKFG